MRELIALQVFLRDFVGLEETSRTLLMAKPNIMTNWSFNTAACFLTRNYASCFMGCESMIKINTEEEN